MITPDTPTREPGFLPEGSSTCVWMAAGLVGYKLCDLDYDCERCPFDAVMKGHAPVDPTPNGPFAPTAPPPTHFPDDRLYHAGHTWAQVIAGEPPGAVRVGIDAFAAWVVGEASGVILSPAGTRLVRGGAGCWIVGPVAPVPLPMPAGGTVLRGNPRLKERPRLAVEDPYGAGWLLEAACPDPRAALEGLADAAGARARADAGLRAFEVEAIAVARRTAESARVGPTLADGGERLDDWRRVLGPQRTHRLARRLLR